MDTQFKAALFDLDGVLIDSEGLYTEFWDNIGKTFHLPSASFAHDIKGCTLRDILERYFPDQETQTHLTQLIHDYEQTMVYQTFPKVTDAIASLKNHGVKCAIVTSSDATKMAYLFNQLGDFRNYFDVVINGSMVTNSKPHPECYLKAAAALGENICDCVVFEDSFQGIESGKRAGAYVVGIATTNPHKSLVGLADEVVDSIADYIL